MTELQRWAKERKCCCQHPERTACAEDRERRQSPLLARNLLPFIGEIEPCECCCHDEFFEDEDDDR